MTHLPYIAGSYGVTVAAILFFAVSTTMRLGRARRQLAVAEAARPAREGRGR